MSLNVRDLKATIISKAWKDPVFKEAFLADPEKTLQQLGYNLPNCEFKLDLPSSPIHFSKLSASDSKLMADQFAFRACASDSVGFCATTAPLN